MRFGLVFCLGLGLLTTQCKTSQPTSIVLNEDRIWDLPTRQNLTYCVDQKSFGVFYEEVLAIVEGASQIWQQYADTTFVHEGSFDSQCIDSMPLLQLRATTDEEADEFEFSPPEDDSKAIFTLNLHPSKGYVDSAQSLTIAAQKVILAHLGEFLGMRSIYQGPFQSRYNEAIKSLTAHYSWPPKGNNDDWDQLAGLSGWDLYKLRSAYAKPFLTRQMHSPWSDQLPKKDLVCLEGMVVVGLACADSGCGNLKIFCEALLPKSTTMAEEAIMISKTQAHTRKEGAFLTSLSCKDNDCQNLYGGFRTYHNIKIDADCYESREIPRPHQDAVMCRIGYGISGIRCGHPSCQSLKVECCKAHTI